jgi:hypothetical protein
MMRRLGVIAVAIVAVIAMTVTVPNWALLALAIIAWGVYFAFIRPDPSIQRVSGGERLRALGAEAGSNLYDRAVGQARVKRSVTCDVEDMSYPVVPLIDSVKYDRLRSAGSDDRGHRLVGAVGGRWVVESDALAVDGDRRVHGDTVSGSTPVLKERGKA